MFKDKKYAKIGTDKRTVIIIFLSRVDVYLYNTILIYIIRIECRGTITWTIMLFCKINLNC